MSELDLKALVAQCKPYRVLYVEDDTSLRQSTQKLLSSFFPHVRAADNGKTGLEAFADFQPDIVISDLNMPEMNGLEMVRQMKARKPNQVILITSAHDEAPYLLELIDLGIDNFIVKPLDLTKFLAVIRKTVHYLSLLQMERDYKAELEQTVALRTEELQTAMGSIEATKKELIDRLCTAAEYKDTDTGKHILRIGLYTGRLAHEMGLNQDFCQNLASASPLHDIGKIAIQDQVLHKPGPLNAEEWIVMASHAEKGKSILHGSQQPSLQMAERIAWCHHERYDGTGYPRGLKGEEIPLEARITNICDQFDALSMRRPYKEPLPFEQVLRIITQGDGRTKPEHFDPQVLAAFQACAPDLHRLYLDNQDEVGR